VTATATPVITTTPIYTTTTTVSGTNEVNAAVYFTYNGGAAVLATANDSTHWSVTGLTLSTAGTNLISVIAQAGTEVDSAPALASVTAASVTLTAPTAFMWSSFVVGTNAGSATPGTVVSSGAKSWTLGVADADTGTNSGYMVNGTTKLTDAIQVGLTAPAAGTTTGTIAAYALALTGSTGYGTSASFDIPLYANQTIETTDAPGSYSITLNYTLTPTY